LRAGYWFDREFARAKRFEKAGFEPVEEGEREGKMVVAMAMAAIDSRSGDCDVASSIGNCDVRYEASSARDSFTRLGPKAFDCVCQRALQRVHEQG